MSVVEDEPRVLVAALQVIHPSATRKHQEDAYSYLEAFREEVMKTLIHSESLTNAPLAFRVRHGLVNSVY
jgi:hypothetical protein